MHANSATICCSCDLRAPSGRKLTFDGIAVKSRGPFRSAEGVTVSMPLMFFHVVYGAIIDTCC